MDDDQETGQAGDAATLAGNEQSEAKTEEKSEVAAETETEDKAEGNDAAGEIASTEKPEAKVEKPSDEDEEDDRPKRRSESGVTKLKRKVAFLEAELQNARGRISSDGVVPQSEIEKEIGPPPKEDDFKGDFLAYQDARIAYNVEARSVAREIRRDAKAAQEARAEFAQSAIEEHNERVSDFRQKVADFDETLKSAANLRTSPTVESLILDSDKSAHLVYHLAKNPDRLNQLNRMSEREAAREIGRIEARLSLPQPKTQTQAPKPVSPPKGGSAAPSQEQRLANYMAKLRAGQRP